MFFPFFNVQRVLHADWPVGGVSQTLVAAVMPLSCRQQLWGTALTPGFLSAWLRSGPLLLLPSSGRALKSVLLLWPSHRCLPLSLVHSQTVLRQRSPRPRAACQSYSVSRSIRRHTGGGGGRGARGEIFSSLSPLVLFFSSLRNHSRIIINSEK